MPDADAIGQWLIVGLWLIGGILVIVTQARSLWRSDPPLDDKYAPRKSTHERLTAIEEHLRIIPRELESRDKENRKIASESREKIYKEINNLRETVAASTRETEIQGHLITQLTTKLDRLIERLS